MEKYDTSQLTEFPRFEPESSQSGVSNFFNKLWKLPLFTPSETGDNGQTNTNNDDRKEASSKENQKRRESEDIKPETGSYADELEGRSLQNVLRRISSLVALGSGSGTRYADTELARYWMPDDISRECYECAARFSTLRRRHHCRVCGQIFCSRCCSQRVPGHIFGCAGGLRVCNYCCNVVLSYLKENDVNGEISPDLRTLQENLQVKFPDNKEKTSKTRENFVFAHDQEERCEIESPTNQEEGIQDLYRQLSFSLPTQQHRYRLVRYSGVWRGADVLQWVMENSSHKTRVQAGAVCSELVRAGLLECVTEVCIFADYALYRPAHLQTTHEHLHNTEECSRLVESVSSYCLDLNLGDNSARLIKTPKQDREVTETSPSSNSNEEEIPNIDQSEVMEHKQVSKEISEWGTEHLRLLMRQMLARAALPHSWLDVLMPLCEQAADIIMPEPNSNDIDIRNYVQVKKVPGGTPKDSCLIHGVVLTKNVAHRGMPQEIANPTILLLDCSIAYQRVEGKLTSLEPVLLQEHEYLSRMGARLAALGARVVLARGGAGRAVCAAVRAAGGALALRVRRPALRRAARAAAADLLHSLDARIGTPTLGTAQRFYVRHFGSKTLMVLEGCANPHLGCCILIRGASLPELIRVKKVVKFMLLACYNWKLEKAFYADIDAQLPEPGMTFDDDLDFLSTNDKTDSLSVKESEFDETVDDVNDVFKNLDETDSPIDITKKTDENISNKADKTDKNSDQASVTEHKSLDEIQKSKYSRKTENSCGVPIRDFSDPLRAVSVDDDVFLPEEETTLVADDQNERWSADDVVLSMSPSILVPPPYLETEAGRRCPFRGCFPTPLIPPVSKPHPPTPRPHHASMHKMSDAKPEQEFHPFVKMAMKTSVDDPSVKAALAHYRATGCRINTNAHEKSCPQYNPRVLKPNKPVEAEAEAEKPKEPIDPYAPENHQKLNLLMYSYSPKSPNVPDFCVNPWVVSMAGYDERHDISLGAYLSKYCFSRAQPCSADNCHVPLNQHVRKFVHGDVCITITCNTIGHSNVDKVKEEQSKQISFWSVCSICGRASSARRLSPEARALSLAVFVCARARPARPLTAHCAHALRHHHHAFQCGLTTACFRFSKITYDEIALPPDVISTNYDTKQMRDSLIAQLNELMLKGHEIFSSACSEAERDQLLLKHHTDALHVALSSPKLRDSPTDVVVRSLWSISDGIIMGEKMLRDAQDKWSSPIVKTKPQEITAEDKSDIEENTDSNSDGGTTYVFTDNSKDIDKEHTVAEEDEDKGDKKTIRQILSQLLSSNQSTNQTGMVSCGVVNVLVFAHQTGSVIAAALATLASTPHRNSVQSEVEEADSNSVNKDKTDGDKSKTSKANEHIEIMLKDGVACRMYYASQFAALRHAVVAPLAPHEQCCCGHDNKLCSIEEGYIRSLAHCVPWATRGGKSGSTFCKTKDDRYVLKEMTKPEWQQFLEFAPHYFNYVTSCRQNKTPSLLARMVGVYSVGAGGAGGGVLVLENVWYGCGPRPDRFDLKGSSRHRLAPPAPPAPPPATQPHNVLMDENLLNLRWERPLFVRSHCGRALWAAAERDTSFLATHSVMDYSLLLAIDERKLVLGIIDYIRTFTWDKKLEHLVKKNLGSGQPTVVSPESYKQRFLAATRKYFLPCPEHWDHLYQVIQP